MPEKFVIIEVQAECAGSDICPSLAEKSIKASAHLVCEAPTGFLTKRVTVRAESDRSIPYEAGTGGYGEG